ncbi:MAG: hypothetical protein KAX49_07695 [Halanaerobiales bacterium]|nr:hypothetical protein [Halanaerobiales bacterium]
MCSQELIGYHGTFVDCVKNILDNGFIFHQRKDHWLGQGIYFYKDDLNQAKVWATVKSRNNLHYRDKEVAVIKVILKVKKDKLLNLNLREDVKKILNFALQLNCDFDPDNVDANRAFVIDSICEEEDFEVVIMSFTHENQTIRDIQQQLGAALGFHFTEQQICVKNDICIVSKECVYPRNDVKIDYKQRKKWG